MYKMHALKTHFFGMCVVLWREGVVRFGAGLRSCLFCFMEKICSFFGHRDVLVNLNGELKIAIEKAINEYGITTFYVGDRGAFDRQVAAAVREMKHKYPNIKLVLVLPYFTNKLNEYKELYEQNYDDVFIPDELAGVHPKVAITKRNRLMVDDSILIISCINRDYGGAYSTVKYAEKKKLPIINLGSIEFYSQNNLNCEYDLFKLWLDYSIIYTVTQRIMSKFMLKCHRSTKYWTRFYEY